MYVQNSINGNAWASGVSSDIYNETYSYDGNGNILYLNRKDASGNMIDQMAYNYQTGTNKLNYIADPYHFLACKGVYIEIFRISGNTAKTVVPAIAVFIAS